MKIIWERHRWWGPWRYRSDEGGMWFGKLYIYWPRVFKPREPV